VSNVKGRRRARDDRPGPRAPGRQRLALVPLTRAKVTKFVRNAHVRARAAPGGEGSVYFGYFVYLCRYGPACTKEEWRSALCCRTAKSALLTQTVRSVRVGIARMSRNEKNLTRAATDGDRQAYASGERSVAVSARCRHRGAIRLQGGALEWSAARGQRPSK